METLLLAASGADQVLSQLFIIFVAAKILAEIFEWLKQPAVVGEILAGVILGPSLLGWISMNDLIHALSEIGVIFLLFTVGLEVKPSALLKVGKKAAFVGILGVVLPFIAGIILMKFYDAPSMRQIFIGAALVATSVGITARVLAAMGKLSSETAQVIMAAAVLDDILGLLILSGVSAMAQGTVDYQELALTSGLSILFTLFMVFAGSKILVKSQTMLDKMKMGHSYFVMGLILCFGLAYLATEVGVAAIIGAFFAGMAMSEISEGTEVHHLSTGVTEFLVPFFLVGIGLQLDLNVFKDPTILTLSLVLTLCAVLTKLVGCGLGAWGMKTKEMLQIGMGMVPRGEVGIIVAQIGLSLGVLDAALYGVVVFMAVATTLIAPPFLKVLYR